MRIQGLRLKDLTGFDETRIVYQDVGKGSPLVFANGLGGTYEAWIHMINHLKERYRILSWDYRGMYASGRPPLDHLAITDHVKDLELILKRENIGKTVLAGWSMGTQVVLEYYRRHPEQVLGIVLICGSAGAPFETALDWSASRYLLPAVFELLERIHPVQSGVIKAVVSIPGALDLLKPLGMLAREGDIETFKLMAADYADLDFEAYNRIMLELGRHDAWDVLEDIRVPTLIFSADRDFFTPLHVSEKMRRMIPDSRLVVVEGGTHYAPLEFPNQLNRQIDRFLEGIRWPAEKKSAAGKRRAPSKKQPGKKSGRKTSRKAKG